MSLARYRFVFAASTLSVGLAVGLLGGCVDPQGAFDAFGERYTKINSSTASTGTGAGGGACMAPAAGVLDGQYVFALAAKINVKKPVALLVNVTTVSDGNGGLTMTMKETPLSYMDQKTPAGPEVDLGSFPVASDGSFTAAFGVINVPGSANPITKDAAITADVTIKGNTCASDPTFICGDVSGKVTAPIVIDLADPPPPSHFTMQKIEGGVYPAPVTDCAKTAAQY